MKILRSLSAAVVAAALTIVPAMAGHVLQPAHHGKGTGGTTPPPSGTTLPLQPNFSACNFAVPTTFNHVWYIDPVNGQTENAYTTAGISMSPTASPHQGDVNHPWKDINAISNTVGNVQTLGYPVPLFANTVGTKTTGGPIAGGDEVLLQSGTAAQYGAVGFGAGASVWNQSGPYLTFKPAPGATVTLAQLIVGNFANVAFVSNGSDDINVQSLAKYPLVKISNGPLASNVVMDSLVVSSTDPATAQSWTAAQWAAASNGIEFTTGACQSVTNSHFFDIGTGAQYSDGTQIIFQNNEIDHIAQDAIDWCGTDDLIDNNFVHDFPNAGAGDHIDAMQGVSCGNAIPQTHRVAITNNTIIWQLDPNLPLASGSAVAGAIAAGGCCWYDWTVTNNKVWWDNWTHGISNDHCINCVIENNTLAGGFITMSGGDVNVLIKNNLTQGLDCKNGDQAGVTMQNNIMAAGGNSLNILCFGGVSTTLTGSTPKPYPGNNFSDTNGMPGEIVNYNPAGFAFDFHLLSTAAARGAGVPVDFSPQVDSLGQPLNSPPDIGAIQYKGATPPPAPTVNCNFYTSPTGSDGNNGTTLATAFKTPGKAATAMEAAGTAASTTCMEAGTYAMTGTLSLTNANDANKTWMAYPGQVPVLDGGSTVATGISAMESNITITGLTLNHFTTVGIQYGNGTGPIPTNGTVTNNTVMNLTVNPAAGQFTHTFGILMQDVPNSVISGNTVSNITGMGIGYGTTHDTTGHVTITTNTLSNVCSGTATDCGAVYVFNGSTNATGVTGFVVSHNTINGFGPQVSSGSNGAPVCLYADDGASNIAYSFNTCYGSGTYGFLIHGGYNVTHTNEIFDLTSMLFVGFQQDCTTGCPSPDLMTGDSMTHSIVYSSAAVPTTIWRHLSSGGAAVTMAVNGNLYFDTTGAFHNVGTTTFDTPSPQMIDASPTVADPLFVAPGSHNYALQASSPAHALGF